MASKTTVLDEIGDSIVKLMNSYQVAPMNDLVNAQTGAAHQRLDQFLKLAQGWALVESGNPPFSFPTSAAAIPATQFVKE